MFFSLGFALLGLFFHLIFEVEAATCKYNEWTVESEAAVQCWCVRFIRQVTITLQGDDEARFVRQISNSNDTIIPIPEETSIGENSSGNYKESGTHQWNQVGNEQVVYASKPLVSLVNDLSDFVERIFQRLDTRIRGAGHYEVVAHYFGFDIFEIRSGFEKSVGSPSRAMIEAIVVRHPELTVEKFARVVEEKARRKDVADLLRAYDRVSLKESV
ncbi:uncharacterized protein [Acropora muricata]|uniref:uncharacterized protein isoform X2 n=1 Tax=Acropora muricata TaxID=159855 RepID=UPI0034E5C4E1